MDAIKTGLFATAIAASLLLSSPPASAQAGPPFQGGPSDRQGAQGTQGAQGAQDAQGIQGRGDRQGRRGERFEQVKSEAKEGIRRRMRLLEKAEACVSAAQDHDALRACRERSREEGKAEMERERAEMEALRGGGVRGEGRGDGAGGRRGER